MTIAALMTGGNAARLILPEDVTVIQNGDFFLMQQANLKNKYLRKFRKQFKGNTNADFLIDKNTGQILLKGNKSKELISTGEYLK